MSHQELGLADSSRLSYTAHLMATFRLFVICLAVASITGCSGKPGIQQEVSDVPEDFTLAVTVMTGRDVPEFSEAHRRPGRFVLFSDGSLHYAEQPVPATYSVALPPLRRVLPQPELEDIWRLLDEIGFADAPDAQPPTNLSRLSVQAPEIVYSAEIHARDRTWTVIHRRTLEQPADPSMIALLRRLSKLAWASDLREAPVQLMPQRYDFGPDPYARFRRTDRQPESGMSNEP